MTLENKRFPQLKSSRKKFPLMLQPNNNHNANNITTKTVVGLRLSNRWETTTTTTKNSKLNDIVEIEQISENKSY